VASFETVALVAELAAAVAPFFLTILERFLRNFGGLGVAEIRVQ
jgi:hypothetical protein